MTPKKSVSLGLAVALSASLLAAPAFAAPKKKPQLGDNKDWEVAYTQEKVRKQQVRQNRGNGLFTPLIHPLTSAWNKNVN